MSNETTETVATPQQIARQTKRLKKELQKLSANARMRDAKGIPAFKTLAGIQTLLIDAGYNLSEEGGYVLAGWESRNSFIRSMQRHAYAAAIYMTEQAKAGTAYVADMDTIRDHPIHLWLESWDYLKKSGRKLLSDDTYTPLGETRNSFLEKIALAHMDCAAQKLELARAQINAGTPDVQGFQLLTQVREFHLQALGIDEIDAQIAYLLNADANEVDAMNAYFTQWGFRTALKQPKKARFMEAQEMLNLMPDLENDPDTFKGTGYDLLSFKTKVEASVKERLHMGIQYAKNNSGDIEILNTIMQQFQTDRQVYGEYDHDEFDKTYWFREIFKQYEYLNFDHFIDSVQQQIGMLRIGDVLEAQDENPVYLFNELEQAERDLLAANVSLKDTEILAKYGIDGHKVRSLMIDLAPYAANYRWNMVFHGNNTAEVRYDAMQIGLAAEERTRGKSAGGKIEYTQEQIRYWDRKTKLQYAAESFAESMIAVRDRLGVEAMIRRGFSAMDSLGEDLNQQVLSFMGMSIDDARVLDRRHIIWNIVQAWRDAQDPDDAAGPRLVKMTDVKTSLADLSPEDQALFYKAVNATPETLEEHRKSLAHDVITDSFERIDGDHPDPLVTFQITQNVYNAINIVDPKALMDDDVFTKLTKGNREDFLKHYHVSKKRHKAAITLLSEPFSVVSQNISGIFSFAQDPANAGEEAFSAIDDLSHALAAEGRSILDADVLAKSGFNAHQLRRMRNEQALEVVRQKLEIVHEKGDYALTIDNWRNHPYTDLSRAFGWITVTTYSPLSDIPYTRAGLGGRRDFMNRLQESGLDMLVKLEHLAKTNGQAKGAQEYLQILSQIRDLRLGLGFDNELDLRRAFISDQALPERAGLELDAMQRALQYMAFPVCTSVFNSKASTSYKYKTIYNMIDESANLKAVDWKVKLGAGDQNANGMIDVLLYDRIGTAMEKFHAGRANPATGVAMIRAFEKLDARHDFITTPWFSDMLEKHGYDTYPNFKGYIIKTRIYQIVRRIQFVYNSYTDEQLDNPAVSIRILNDLDAIDDMCTSGLIDTTYKNNVFNTLDVTPGWVDQTHRNAAYHALPMLIRQARDPFLPDDKRIYQFNRIKKLINEVGPDVFQTLNVNEDFADLLTLHHKATLHLAGVNLATDLIRGKPDGVSPAIKEAVFLFHDAETDLADKNTLRNLGLHRDEANHLALLSELSVSRAFVDQIGAMPLDTEEEIREGYTHLIGFYNHALEKGIDLFSDTDRARIGIVSDKDFEEAIDHATFRVLNQLSQPLLEMVEQAPDMVAGQAEHITLLIRFSRLEDRFTKEILEEEGVLTLAEIAQLVEEAATPKDVTLEPAVIAQVQQQTAAPVDNVIRPQFRPA